MVFEDFRYGESARVPPEVAIPVTYNRVRDRLAAFAVSNVVLVMLWTNLLRAVSS